MYFEEKQIPVVWAKFEAAAATNGAMSNRAKHHLDTLLLSTLLLVGTRILRATGDASTDDPAVNEKEAKWAAVKARG